MVLRRGRRGSPWRREPRRQARQPGTLTWARGINPPARDLGGPVARQAFKLGQTKGRNAP